MVVDRLIREEQPLGDLGAPLLRPVRKAPSVRAMSRHEGQRSDQTSVVPRRQPAPRPARSAAASILSLNRAAGNAAVTRLLARDPATDAPPKPKPIAVGAVAGGRTIPFTTKSAKLGDVQVHFTGTVTVSGTASLEGDAIPDDKDLPEPANKNHDARVHKWGESRVREQLAAALNSAAPTGDGQDIALDVLGHPLTLALARGIGGMPEFAVTGEFASSTPADLNAGTVKIPKASLWMTATAEIAPGPSKGGAAPGKADDSLIKARGYAFDGRAAAFQEGSGRTGAVALWQAVNDISVANGFNKKVVERWLSSIEQRIAFLVHMRSYFATDAETVEHFKKLRPVQLHTRGVDTGLIMHEEAALRLEAVRDELPAGSMPSTDGGWPRSDHVSLHTQATIANLHDLGLAVDFNAYETPNVEDQRLRDLVLFVTKGPVWQEGPSTQGKYADMITHTEERSVMPDPSPSSALGKKLEKVATEAQAASDRSEQFRASVDVKALLDLRTKRRANKAAWSTADDAALAKVIKPWTKAVDDEVNADQKTIDDSGLDPKSLKHGAALATEAQALEAVVDRATAVRAGIKTATLSGRQRTAADPLIAQLTKAVGPAGAAPSPPANDADRIKALDDLIAAGNKRLGVFNAISRRDRAENVGSSLKDAGWVLGDKDWNAKKKQWELQVKDPSAAQLADLGFFTLRDHSHSGPSGAAQPGAFDIAFMKAMVKHGFNPLAYNSGAGGTDSMHFELRWHGSAMTW